MDKSVTEREINVIDMFWAICLKWRQMLIGAVIFAVLAGGFSYLKSAQAAKASIEPTQKIALEDIELEEDSQREAISYLDYKQLYNEQKQYNDNAPIMQLDAGGFYRSVITYYVDNHFTVEYPLMSKTNNINAMVEAYRSELRNEEFTAKLQELTGCNDAEISYEKELIDCNNKYGKLSTIANETGILRISIYGSNEEECKVLAELVKESLQAGKAAIAEKLGEHDITLIEDNCDYISDSELLKYQQENIAKLSTFVTNSSNLKSKLTDSELSFVDAYEREQSLENELETEENVDILVATVSKKLIVLGFVGGAIVVFCVVAVFYLFNNRLRLEDDFEMLYGIILLGNVILKDKKKKKWLGCIDNFFNKMRHLNKRYFEEDEAVSMVAAGIKIASKKKNATKVYVTGATIGETEKHVIEKLKNELKKTNVELVAGKPILYDAEALEQSAECGFVVLLERAGASLYKEIAEEIDICQNQGMEILGTVVVAK